MILHRRFLLLFVAVDGLFVQFGVEDRVFCVDVYLMVMELQAILRLLVEDNVELDFVS